LTATHFARRIVSAIALKNRQGRWFRGVWGKFVPKELFDIFANHAFDGEHCFLCGTLLNTSNRSEEHVFPMWLQAALGLQHKTLVLSNKTTIKYMNLKIPCCDTCNNVHLGALERRVSEIMLDNERSLSELTNHDINCWISKIYIGILWKELELRYDRRDPASERIMPKKAMNIVRFNHFYLQSCRKKMTFIGLNTDFPNSIVRLRCKTPKEGDGQFDYMDNFTAHAVGIRILEKGIIMLFDGGLHESAFPDFVGQYCPQFALHPAQFKEVYAKLMYKASLSMKVPYYSISQNTDTDEFHIALLAFDDHNRTATSLIITDEQNETITVVPVIPDEVLKADAYDDWNQEHFAHCLVSVREHIESAESFVIQGRRA
jgi:hypothetical protein